MLTNSSLPSAKLAVPSTGSTIQATWSCGQALDEVGILCGRLLADHDRAGQQVHQQRRQGGLGALVGDGDDVAGPLLALLVRGQLAEARLDFRRRDFRDQRGDGC